MYYTISEFAAMTGVSESTLRLWDKKGMLSPHHRTKGNIRMYTKEQALNYLGEQGRTETAFCLEELQCLSDSQLENLAHAISSIQTERKEKGENI